MQCGVSGSIDGSGFATDADGLADDIIQSCVGDTEVSTNDTCHTSLPAFLYLSEG